MDDNLKKEKSTQVYAAFSFGLVCFLIGVPVWWKTTEVYRVNLPYADIEQLSSRPIEHSAYVEVISLSSRLDNALPDFSHKFMSSLNDNANSSVHITYHITIRDASDRETSAWRNADTLEALDSTLWDGSKPANSSYGVFLLPHTTLLHADNVFVGEHGIVVTSPSENDLNSIIPLLVSTVRDVMVRETVVIKSQEVAQSLTSQKPDKEAMRWFRSHPAYDVTFTLVNQQPDIKDVTWDIRHAVNVYLKPFLTRLAPYISLSVSSQVLYYIGHVASPNRDVHDDSYFYTEHDLPRMINPLEAKLGSGISTRPVVNFVVYVPSAGVSPVYIKDSAGNRVASNAFLSPRWGGLVIYNTQSTPQINISPQPSSRPLDVDMRTVMGVFITQLRQLLNVHVEVADKRVLVQQLVGQAVVRDWEVAGWLRCRCVENLATAKSSLRSLIRLLDKISNIVINDDVGEEVEKAVSSIKLSESLFAEGRLHDAFLSSQQAIIASEKAFFDPSLLELLYFPEDQKYAIYIPLFLPISMPIFSSLIQAVKWCWQTWRVRQKVD